MQQSVAVVHSRQDSIARQRVAPNPASADVGRVVSPGRGNCTTSPQLWRASRKSVADREQHQHQALSSAQPLVATITDGTAGDTW